MFLGYTSRFRLKAPRKEIEETQSSVRHSVCPSSWRGACCAHGSLEVASAGCCLLLRLLSLCCELWVPSPSTGPAPRTPSTQ